MREQGGSFDRYRMMGLVGAGTCGSVHAAYDTLLDRRVALKLLRVHGEEPAASARRARLLREAQVMARLAHPNVVAVFDAGEANGVPFISMQFVEGRTLRAWLAEGRRSWREIVGVFVEAGRGLQAAHAAGVVHRDFKPENVLIDGAGVVRVGDFGLARPPERSSALPAGRVGTLTESGALMGTPAYMAPEQLLGGPTDHRSDQYAFCAALYEALWGRRPYAGETLEELVFNVTEGNLSAPPRRETPARVRALVLRGLQADPRRRFGSMEELVSRLAPPPRRARAWISAALLAALAAVSGAAWSAARARAAQFCRGAESRLAGVWEPTQRREVEQALLGAGKRFAVDSSRAVVQRLDAYAEGWRSAYTEACEATRLRGDQTEAAMERRMRCLDRRLGGFAALVAVLHRADAEVAEHAVPAAEALLSAQGCLSREVNGLGGEALEEPRRAQVDRVRQMVDVARVTAAAGDERRGLVLAAEAVREARPVDHAGLLGEALLGMGEVQRRLKDPGAAETLREAILQAERSGDDALRGRALLLLAWHLLGHAGRLGEAERLASTVEAIAERIGPSDWELPAGLEELRATLSNWSGRPQEALRHARLHLDLLSKALPAGHSRLGLAEVSAGTIFLETGALSEARERAREARRILEASLGPEHPWVADALLLEGRLAVRIDAGEALPRFDRAARILSDALGPRSFRSILADLHAALALLRLGRHREVEQRVGWFLSAASPGRQEEHLAIARYRLRSELRLARGHCREALREARAGLAVAESFDESGGVLGFFDQIAFVRVAEICGRPDETLAAARRAMSVAERGLPEDPDLATALTAHGAALQASGRPRASLAPLERAWTSWPPGTRAPSYRAETGFFLARGLWNSGADRRRAVDTARLAHQELMRSQERPQPLLGRLEAWLHRRASSPGVAMVSRPAPAPPAGK